jgi:hypothetical protein
MFCWVPFYESWSLSAMICRGRPRFLLRARNPGRTVTATPSELQALKCDRPDQSIDLFQSHSGYHCPMTDDVVGGLEDANGEPVVAHELSGVFGRVQLG